MPRLLVLQHIGCEPLGLIEPALKERGMEYRYVRPFAGEPIPKDLSGWDGLIALGGPMSANDGEHPGFIADEQIGRASCRERVGRAVVAGVGKRMERVDRVQRRG